MKVTGSTTLSQVAKGLGVESGKVFLNFEGFQVEGGMVRPSVRIGTEDFLFAIACMGAIADTVLAKVVERATARATGESLSPELEKIVSEKMEKMDRLRDTLAEKLPMIEREASVRLKGTATLLP